MLLSGVFCLANIDGMIIKTTDSSYDDRWYRTLGTTVPHIAGAKHVYKGQKLFVGVAVTHYQLDHAKNTSVLYYQTITAPTAKTFFEIKNNTAIKASGLNPNYVHISEDFSTLILKSNDAFGTYQIKMSLKDEMNGSTKVLESSFKLVPLPPYQSIELSTKENFWQWKNNYYKQKQPEKALPYFVFFTKSELPQKRSELLPAISFFRTIMRENTFLFTEFKKAFDDGDDPTKYLLALLLYESTSEDSYKKYMEEDYLEQVTAGNIPDSDEEITDAVQIDMLWAEFSANGQQAPLLKIIRVLENAKFAGFLEKLKRSQQNKELQVKAYKDAVYQGASWSLKSRLKNEELVRSYANWIYLNEDLTAIQKKELGKLLKETTDTGKTEK